MSVKELLATLPRSAPIFYFPNPGNAGDALIASGTFKLFRECNKKIVVVDSEHFDSNGKIVCYGGGGNLVGLYPQAKRFLHRHHRTAKKLILLPHTIARNEDLLAQFGTNVILFARERTSYRHLQRHARQVDVRIDHDLALHLDTDEILRSSLMPLAAIYLLKKWYRLRKNPAIADLPRTDTVWKNVRFEWKNRLTNKSPVGAFFRTDLEKTLVPPADNADLSLIYAYGTKNEALNRYATIRFMQYIDRFSKVRTNRLHVCIAAAMLGKEVEFHPNSYYKNQAVYEYSLRDRFP